MHVTKTPADVLFIRIGAVLILAMHAGFAFLELGTVRSKSQVNALVKILCDFSVSTVAYFLIGYGVSYGIHFFDSAAVLAHDHGYELTRFFFLLTFAAAVPAIVSGGIAERVRFYPQLLATSLVVGFVYPLFERLAWNDGWGWQDWLQRQFARRFTILPDRWWSMRSVAGLRWPQWCCWAHAGTAMRGPAISRFIRPRAFRSWRSARGSWWSAGLASTS